MTRGLARNSGKEGIWARVWRCRIQRVYGLSGTDLNREMEVVRPGIDELSTQCLPSAPRV